MTNKKRIGLLANFTEGWIGGLYYIKNLLAALKSLPVEEQPEVVLFYHERTPTELFDQVDYPFYKKVCLQRLPKWKRAVYKGIRIVFNKNLQLKEVFDSEKVDVIYPIANYSSDLKIKTKTYYWIFDFQHKFLPQYFTKEEIKRRDLEFEQIANFGNNIVVSSNDAKNHFFKFYPSSEAEVKVLSFLSLLDFDKLAEYSIDNLRTQYNLGLKPYFLTSNQFWKHKNHMAILKALKEIDNPNFNMVFTGLEEDPRNPNYVNELKQYIKEHNLGHCVFSFGFIPRYDQLALLLHAAAAVQPSKFEGWNTFIEDSKTLGKKVIASDLSVHREQLEKNGLFFNPDDHQHLAHHLQACYSEQVIKDIVKLKQIANKKEQDFGRKILNILQ